MNSIVTIILPAYNAEKYITRCIESVLKQTYKNFEFIIIDDGSTDNTLKIARDFAKKDCRINVISQNNCGVSKTRNYGVQIAKGEFILFIDSDDYIDSNMIYHLLEKSIQTGSDVIQCGYKVFGDNETGKEICAKESMFLKEEAVDFYLDNLELCVVPWNKLIRKDCIKNIKFPENRRYEDEAIMYRLFFEAESIYNINEKFYHYYVNEEGFMQSSEGDLSKTIDLMEAKKDLYIYIKENVPTVKKKAETERVNNLFFSYLAAIKTKKNDAIKQKQYMYIKREFLENYRMMKKSNLFKKKTLIIMRWIPVLFKCK